MAKQDTMQNVYKPFHHLKLGKSIYTNESDTGLVIDLTSNKVTIINKIGTIYEFMVFDKSDYNPEKELKPFVYLQLSSKSFNNIKKTIAKI